MAFWDIDLTTRAGARGAAHTAGTMLYLYAGATAFGALLTLPLFAPGNPHAIGAIALVLAMIALALFAGFRLRNANGEIVGWIALVMVAIDLVIHLVTLSGIPGIVLDGVVLVLLVQGMRGVRALARGTGFDDDDTDTFA